MLAKLPWYALTFSRSFDRMDLLVHLSEFIFYFSVAVVKLVSVQYYFYEGEDMPSPKLPEAAKFKVVHADYDFSASVILVLLCRHLMVVLSAGNRDVEFFCQRAPLARGWIELFRAASSCLAYIDVQIVIDTTCFGNVDVGES